MWKARDTTLGRDVALKILPDHLALDPDRLARFKREAQILASLNHPNIAAIYGFQESEGVQALVLELVEGPTLADRIAQGPIPVDEALPIAKQIAEALEAPHEQGIIHRDLKPANVKLRPDGTVKVLDFGLAKAIEPASAAPSGLSMSPTITSPAATHVGVILGTAAYMSPEQAKGRPVDARADVWAFGAVLYEMLTGRRAFDGNDVCEVFAGIIKSEPDWKALPALPPLTASFLKQCLNKDPKQRLAHMQDMRLALDGAFEMAAPLTASNAPVTMRRPAWQRYAPYAVAAAVVLAPSVFLAFRSDPRPEVMRFQIHAPPGSTLPLGTPAISADGRMLADTVNDPDGVRRIHVRQIDRVESRVLPGTENALHPFWSPDGRAVAFVSFTGRQLMRIDVEGGKPRVLASDVNAPWHGTWNQNGDILFLPPPGVVSRVSAEGGAVTPVASLDEARNESRLDFPFFMRDGRRFLVRVVTNGMSSIQLATIGSMARTMVVDDVLSAPILARTPGGKTYLLFMKARELMAQEFDETSGMVRGNAVAIVTDIGQVANPPYHPTVGVSPSGVLAFQQAGGSSSGQLVWVDRAGVEVGRLPANESLLRPQLAPDGLLAVGHRPDETGTFAIWVTDLQRVSSSRATFGGANDRDAVLSQDGKRLAFRRLDDQLGTYLIDVDGDRSEERLTVSGSVTSWSPDGRYLLGTRSADLMLWPVDGAAKPITIVSRGGRSRQGQFSPDGRHFAFTSDESGRDEVYVQAMPPAKARQKVSINGGLEPRWRRDGKELFFLSPDNAMMVADVKLGDPVSLGVPRELFRLPVLRPEAGYDVRGDGQQFLLAGFGTAADDAPITVVVNWWVELE